MPSETHSQRRASLSDVRKREDDCEEKLCWKDPCILIFSFCCPVS